MTAVTHNIDLERSGTGRIDWSPYLVGAGIGVLSWVAFGLFGDPLGVTTAYTSVASWFAVPIVGSEAVAQNSYWKSMPLKWDYGVWFLVGISPGCLPLCRAVRNMAAGAGARGLGGALWTFGDQALRCRLSRRCRHHVRRAPRRRLHERARDFRRTAACTFELAVPGRNVCDRPGRFGRVVPQILRRNS